MNGLLAVSAAAKINTIVAALVACGVLVLGLTFWFWKTTKPEPESLGPLEVMSSKRWRAADRSEQRQRISAARPEGSELTDERGDTSEGLAMLVRNAAPRREARSFDDLSDASLAPEHRSDDVDAVVDRRVDLAKDPTGAAGRAAYDDVVAELEHDPVDDDPDRPSVYGDPLMVFRQDDSG